MTNTFPVDTKVHLILKSCGIRIQTAGTVRAFYPALGMGICFAEIGSHEEPQLKQLLDSLTGHSSTSIRGLAPEGQDEQDRDLANTVASADPSAFLAEIKQFFSSNSLLSRGFRD